MGDDKMLDFTVLNELADEGYSDYLVLATPFEGVHSKNNLRPQDAWRIGNVGNG